jgi:membrane glycosyltransferase
VTTLVTDGLSITGIANWVMATLIIWLATVVASLVLPLFLFKEVLGNGNKAKK